jgi:hypothetical protein
VRVAAGQCFARRGKRVNHTAVWREVGGIATAVSALADLTVARGGRAIWHSVPTVKVRHERNAATSDSGFRPAL